jgi:hypothetical protein
LALDILNVIDHEEIPIVPLNYAKALLVIQAGLSPASRSTRSGPEGSLAAL